MGVEVLMARDQLRRPRWRYQRLRGELDGGDGEEVSASASALGAERICRARRQLPLRRRVGKVAVAAAGCSSRSSSSSSNSKRVPLLFRMARSGGGRKVRLMRRLVLLLPARRVAALFAELVRRLAAAAASVVDDAAAECPTIVFSSQWGLPVLSHGSYGAAGRTARLRAFYLERSLSSSGAGSGSGSPC